MTWRMALCYAVVATYLRRIAAPAHLFSRRAASARGPGFDKKAPARVVNRLARGQMLCQHTARGMVRPVVASSMRGR
jgi:hypothetical protein